jgi:Cof subfamily protein (haloacid dehalogenase superfamily)
VTRLRGAGTGRYNRAVARIRLVALDLDGTLLHAGNRIADEDAQAVRDAVAAGVHVVLSTSRWFTLALTTAEALGIPDPLICHNGALVKTPAGEELAHHRIDGPTAEAIVREAEDAGVEPVVTVDDVTYWGTARTDVDPARFPAGMVVERDIARRVRNGCTAFLFFGERNVRAMLERLDGRYAGGLNLAWGYSETYPPYLNVVRREANKGAALLAVCERLGVGPDDALAMGDAAPDLEMLRVVGWPVAMGNAPEEVRREARAVAPSNREGGVAWAVRELVL